MWEWQDLVKFRPGRCKCVEKKIISRLMKQKLDYMQCMHQGSSDIRVGYQVFHYPNSLTII